MKTLITACFILLLAIPAHATLTRAGTLLHDDQTNLDWVDVDLTGGAATPADVPQGTRYATYSEVLALLSRYLRTDSLAAQQEFIVQLRPTAATEGPFYQLRVVFAADDGSGFYALTVSAAGLFWYDLHAIDTPTSRIADTGMLLVRTAVPEPLSLAYVLTGIGLVCVWCLRRRD